jgi:SAM-dependent methyltransferase
VDVVLALWMLYHVSDIELALSEMRRVLKPGGQVIVATNSNDHGDLGEIVTAALQMTLGRPVHQWMYLLDFTVDNAEAFLSTCFGPVGCHVQTQQFELPDPDPIVSYVTSLRDAITALNPDVDFDVFLQALAEESARRLQDGPIVWTRRSGFFTAVR